MGPAEVRTFCEVEPPAEKLLKAAMQQLHLSARAYHRVLKLARTIANLADRGQSCGGGYSVPTTRGYVKQHVAARLFCRVVTARS